MRRSRGPSPTHVVLLVGVATLLATLTLARVQLYAVYENERDAVALLERMGARLAPAEVAPDAPLPAGRAEQRLDLRAAVEAANLTVGNPSETHWLDDGRVLRRRGYLFDLVGASDGSWCLRAWPWRAGSSGVAAYVFDRSSGLLGHRNAAEDRPDAWSGPANAPRGPYSGRDWIVLGDPGRLVLASRMP